MSDLRGPRADSLEQARVDEIVELLFLDVVRDLLLGNPRSRPDLLLGEVLPGGEDGEGQRTVRSRHQIPPSKNLPPPERIGCTGSPDRDMQGGDVGLPAPGTGLPESEFSQGLGLAA